MKQKGYLKLGLLRLLTILIPLFFLFLALALTSLYTPLPSKKKDLLCPFMLIVLPPLKNTTESSSPWLQNSRFFQTVRSDFNTEEYPSLELLFYLPLYPTKDKRWLVFQTSLSSSQMKALRQLPKTPLPPLKNRTTSYSPENISSFTFNEIKKQHFPHTPLTLRDLLSQFPKQKWFLHLMIAHPQDSFESPTDQKEMSSLFYITSNNENLLKQLSEKQMTVIYNFRSLLRFQLLRVFLLERLFSFPGQGLIIPSNLPLSPTTMKRLIHSNQWLFLKQESSIANLSPQRLKQVKGLITREWNPALKWIQDKNPCLSEN